MLLYSRSRLRKLDDEDWESKDRPGFSPVQVIGDLDAALQAAGHNWGFRGTLHNRNCFARLGIVPQGLAQWMTPRSTKLRY